MQWLAAICVRRPVFTWVLMLSLVVIGVASMRGLGVDRFPNVDFPIVTVTTVLRGASPEQIETEVSDRLEESINTISGLDELRSTSFEGLSVVIARFDLDKDTSEAAQDVRDRVNRVLSQLPQNIEQPRVERLDPDAAPIMIIAVSAPGRSTREITEFAFRRLRRQIESLEGVGGVTILGGRQRQINITIDPERLQSYGLTAVDVQRSLATQNVEIPGGAVIEGQRTIQLRVQGRLRTVAEFNDIVISTRGGLPVHLRDIGSAEDAEADPSSLGTLNGHETVMLAVRKQSGTNTVAVIDALRAAVDEIRPSLPAGYQLQIVRDESEFVRNAIHAVEEHLVMGSLFAALVVLLFLWNGRSTVISALAIPTSIISTFVLIKAMGLTLNVITLLALTLSVGIVIDDAIVVLENIVKFIEEKGMPPRRAAVLATKEIGLAVLATTLSLVAVFLPIGFMGGIVGRFMKSFGFTMSFAIMVSLLVSFTLTPMLSSRWLSPTGKVRPKHVEEPAEDLDAEHRDPPPGPRREEKQVFRAWRRGERAIPAGFESSHEATGLYGVLERAYLKLLAFAMGRRWIVVLLMLATFFSMIPLGKHVQKNFLPLEDESRFEVNLRAPEGTSLRQTQLVSDRIGRAIRAIPGVQYTVVTVGSPPGDISGRAANQAQMFVALVPPTDRRITQQDIMTRVRNDILPRFASENLRVIVNPVNAFGGGGSDSANIQYVVRGPDLDQLQRYSEQLMTRLRHTPGVVDVDSTYVTGNPEYTIRIDRARAADLGVSVADIASTLRALMADDQVTEYSENGEEYEVHLRASDTVRTSIDRITQVTVPTGIPGRSARLGDFIDVHESAGPTSILRLARQRQIMVYANVTAGASEAAVLSVLDQERAAIHPLPGYTLEPSGRSKELGRAAGSFAVAFLLSLVFMYLVLAAQFESWIHPVTILLALPLTVPFALLSAIVFGQSMNINSTLGILVLFGIVKKNSILQVDHMRDLRRRGLDRADAVMIGNRDRLRPILMTTVAFVAGMIPLVASSGAGSGTNRAVGTVIIGGQTLALLLTLLATPTAYTLFDDIANSRVVRGIGAALRWPVKLVDRVFSGTGHHAAAPTHTASNDERPVDSAAE